jgi:hypothetical protein
MNYRIISKVLFKMDCNKNKNLEHCSCSYEPCNRKGCCCNCIKYHLKMRQLPGCCFNTVQEKTFDRSFEHFSRLVEDKKGITDLMLVF